MRFETLCYVLDGGRVLMIEKRRGLGAGKLNAPGGKVERGETPEEAAIREVREEVGVEVKDLEFMGVLEFVNNGSIHSHCYVFISRSFDGVPKETEEARPVWVSADSLPYSKMWEDDKLWLPLVLKGKKVFARFWFKDWQLVSYRIFEMVETDA